MTTQITTPAEPLQGAGGYAAARQAQAGAWAGRPSGALALLEDYKMKRGLIFGGILVAALLAFELFNFSTTEYALNDFLGAERFLGLRWATILALAFCGIDFAGLARLFTPERGDGEPIEVWYLLGAWFLGATLNAMATWWAVTLALLQHDIGNEVLNREQVLAYVPVFVAALVWLTRILIIGTFSVAGTRLFSQVEATLQTAEAAVRQAAAMRGPRPFEPASAARAAAPARVIGQGPAAGPAAQPRPRPAPARPAPKPAPPSQRSAQTDPWGADWPHEEREPVDDAAYAPRPAGRPANGINRAKTIE